MAALPYMQLYVADYLADTTHLTAEEHGAYMLLLFSYWQTGKPLRIDRLATVARIPNERWNSVADTLSEFFHVTPTHWVHFRVEADLEGVNSKSVAASNAGKASAKARALKKQQELNDRSTDVEDLLQQKTNHIDTDTDTDTDTEDQNHSLNAGEEIPQIAFEPEPAPEPVNPKAPVEMTLDWTPDTNLLKTYCVHFGVSTDLFTREAVAPFTAHHETAGTLNTQSKWVSLLVKWVKDDKNRASNVRQFVKRETPSRHTGFAERDYTADLIQREDGTYAL
ncbi:YdaU family protein [Pseudomonas helleri]|uniref:YdaU family protein n=1 Tax=Pseudomonas helleri TaxID=1608996 RepID=UPI0037C8FF31